MSGPWAGLDPQSWVFWPANCCPDSGCNKGTSPGHNQSPGGLLFVPVMAGKCLRASSHCVLEQLNQALCVGWGWGQSLILILHHSSLASHSSSSIYLPLIIQPVGLDRPQVSNLKDVETQLPLDFRCEAYHKRQGKLSLFNFQQQQISLAQ